MTSGVTVSITAHTRLRDRRQLREDAPSDSRSMTASARNRAGDVRPHGARRSEHQLRLPAHQTENRRTCAA